MIDREEQEWRENFSRALRVRMRVKKMKQKELAEEAGVTEAAMSGYMTCRRTPRVDVVAKFAKSLECSTDELIRFD